MDTRRDPATDLVIRVLLGVGCACVGGLALAQVGWFRLWAVLAFGVAAVAVACLTGRARREGGPGTPPATWAERADGPAVFLLALALYAPGYDTSLYSADATVYLGSGAAIARTGSLAIADPLLDALPPSVEDHFFVPYTPREPTVRVRSLGGLTYDVRDRGTTYATFAKFPSIWLAIGHAVGGAPAAVLTSPVLAAGAMAAFFLLLRRTIGRGLALLAVVILGAAVPQVMLARVSLSEIGAQFFLWGGLLALSRWYEVRSPVAALAAGIGLGCAGLARVEMLGLLPLAAATAWILGGSLRIPWAAWGTTAVLFAYGLALLVAYPSHYHRNFADHVAIARAAIAEMLAEHPAATAGGLVGLLGVVVWSGRLAIRGGGGFRTARVVGSFGVLAWAIMFLFLPRSSTTPLAGARLLPHYATLPTLVLAALGLPFLARRCWSDPAGRLAVVAGTLAAAHLLLDPHAVMSPIWAARRFLPAALPVLFAGAATSVAVVARWSRPAAAVLAGVLLASTASRTVPVWRVPYLKGTGEAVADIASRIPSDAVVLIDPALSDILLDVPLWLVHGRETVQLRGTAGSMDGTQALARLVGGRPLFLVAHGLLRPPVVDGLTIEPVSDGSYTLLPIGSTSPQMLLVRTYRLTSSGNEKSRGVS